MRIGVNIPNELMRRLQPLKPELNISQICRDAIASHVEKYENAIANLDGDSTKAVLERVTSEELRRRSILYVDWEAQGYEFAVAWVKAAEWQDWNQWHSIQAHLERQGRPEWDIEPRLHGVSGSKIESFDDRWHAFHERIMSQSDEFLDWMDENNINPDWDVSKREFGRAWVAYLKVAWQRIHQRREEWYEARRKERLMAGSNHPEPEIPDHLFGDVQSPEEQSFQVVPHHAGYTPGVDPLRLNHLIDDLDMEIPPTYGENGG